MCGLGIGTFAVLGVLWLCLFDGIHSLKDVKIFIPVAVIRGKDAILRCHYDLEGDLLYAVKWYKGRLEFFRYIPTDSPKHKTFPLRGATVKMDASNGTHVYLRNVSEEADGEYSCEISADAPSFYTKIVTAKLNVVDLPTEDPAIDGLKIRYHIGELLRANCSSGRSRPPTNLTWYVNGRKLKDHQQTKKLKPPDGGLGSSYSTLHLVIKNHLFYNGRLKVRCVARIYDVYHRSFEKSVDLEKKHRHSHKSLYSTTESFMFEFGSNLVEYHALPAERRPDATLTFRAHNGGGSLFISLKVIVPLFTTLFVLHIR